MKVKISKSPILFFVCVIMALEMRFANIFQLPYLKVYANMTLVAIIITTLLFLNTIVNNYIYNTLKPYRSQINIIVLVMTLAIVVITIYSYNKYGQTLFNYFSCFRVQLYFMLTASIIFIFTKQEGYDYFLKILVVMTIIYVVLCFINSFSYTFRGRLIWETLSFGFRKDRLRCQAPFSFVIVVPYVFSKIFTEKLKKDKAKWLAIFGLFTAFIFYICMTRMLNTAFYAFLAFSIVLIPKSQNLRRTILIIYAIALVILVATGRLPVLIEYIQSRDENLDDSAQARINSINYFKTFAAANPWFSMGYVLPTDDHFKSIFAGPLYTFFFDDIGIMNVYLHYGIVGSIPYVVFLIRIIYLIIKIYFYNKSEKRLFFLGMMILIAVSQVSLSLFDGQRIMGAVVLWALCEYEAYITSPKNKPERNKRISIRRNNENHTIQLRLDKQRRRSGVQSDGE